MPSPTYISPIYTGPLPEVDSNLNLDHLIQVDPSYPDCKLHLHGAESGLVLGKWSRVNEAVQTTYLIKHTETITDLTQYSYTPGHSDIIEHHLNAVLHYPPQLELEGVAALINILFILPDELQFVEDLGLLGLQGPKVENTI